MENKNSATTTPAEPCLCRDFSSEIAALLGIRSPEARQHLRNARIEMLKAVRSIIDHRIDHLSRAEKKGTHVPVE